MMILFAPESGILAQAPYNSPSADEIFLDSFESLITLGITSLKSATI